jgi:hypothetical protein
MLYFGLAVGRACGGGLRGEPAYSASNGTEGSIARVTDLKCRRCAGRKPFSSRTNSTTSMERYPDPRYRNRPEDEMTDKHLLVHVDLNGEPKNFAP